MTNGAVRAVAHAGGITYIGGDFTYVGPDTGNFVPIDADTGVPLGRFPKIAETVYACAPDGAGGWYIGGAFTQVGGQPRNNIARILADGSVSAWNPNADGTVRALAISGPKVYASGNFTSIGGQVRNHIAALDATGAATSWNPDVDGYVYALAVSGTTIFAGGNFVSIGGKTRRSIAALDTTGSATSWNPDVSGTIYALAVSGTMVYAGGNFTIIGGQTRSNIAELDANSAGIATAWNANANRTVYALAVSGTTVYAGGYFTSIGGQRRNSIAALDANSTGTATAWNPNAHGAVLALAVSDTTVYAGGYFTNIGGQGRNYIAALDAYSTGIATAWNPDAGGSVNVLAVSGTTVYAGGWFNSIGGKTRNCIAALDATGIPTSWDPGANGRIRCFAVSGTTVYAGGEFTSIGGQARNRIAALNANSTGTATDWNPNAIGWAVYALACTDTIVYAGGNFSSIGRQTRNNIAALDVNSTGTATAWKPDANNVIYALAVSGTTVYAGGPFTSIGGQARNHIAALDANSTGTATAWNPNANYSVLALAVSGMTIYASGHFTRIGGLTQRGIAAFDATGALTGWNPNASSRVGAVAISGDGATVYAGGDFTRIGAQTRNRLASLDAAGDAAGWNPNADGEVYALAISDTAVYAGGDFWAIGGQARRGYAQFEISSTTVAPEIAEIPDATIPEGMPYDGPAPMLTTGTTPMTWSLAAGPAEMTINTVTGVVSWASPVVTGSPHAVTIRATNSAGFYDETWALTVQKGEPVPPTSGTLSGAIIWRPAAPPLSLDVTSLTIIAVDTSGTVVSSSSVNASNGEYSLNLPIGFSGWVIAQSPQYVFHPFRRAYDDLSGSMADQNFEAIVCVRTLEELQQDYAITYKRNGKGRDLADSKSSSGTAISVTDGVLKIEQPGDKDTLLLAKSRSVIKNKGIPRAIRGITTEGGFGALRVAGDMDALTVGKDLTRLTATGASVGGIEVGGAIGAISMSGRSDIDATSNSLYIATNISAKVENHSKAASISLNGVRLESLSAPGQNFSAITLASKAGIASDRKKRTQISGLMGGATSAPDIEVGSATKISMIGCGLKSGMSNGAMIKGTIKSLTGAGLVLNRVFRISDLNVAFFHSTADTVTVSAGSGRISGYGYYLVDGRIAKFSATARKHEPMTGVIGAPSDLLSFSTLGGLDVTQPAGALFVVSGTGASVPGNSDILNVAAPNGLYAKFYAGATLTPENLLTPNYAGSLPFIHTSMNVASDSIANVYGSPKAKQQAVVKPKAAFPKIRIYYNNELKTVNSSDGF